MDFKDYYATLGVGKKASQDDIQKAYRKLARKYHPDVNTSDGAEDRFKEITEAYEVLKDDHKREQYDRFGKDWQSYGGAPPGWQNMGRGFSGGSSGAGFSDFFELLFGGGRGGGRAGAGSPFSGFGGNFSGGFDANLDQNVTLALTLEEAARGGLRELTLRDPRTGDSKNLSVNLPRGIREGQKLRLAGKGLASPDGRTGDLFLQVGIRPHSRFRLDGLDLHTSLPVAPWQAALGGEVSVRTLDGTLKLKVPKGSSTGRKIRLRGKGFPNPKGNDGDLFAEIKVMVPDTLTDRERELFEELAEISTFKAR